MRSACERRRRSSESPTSGGGDESADEPRTIGRFLALHDRDSEAAWVVLEELALRVPHRRVKQRCDAEDVAHDILLRVMSDDLACLRRAGRRVLLCSWLRKMAWHIVADGLRRKDSSLAAIPGDLEVAEPFSSTDLTAPEAFADLRILHDRIEAAADQLPPPYREIVRLQRLELWERRRVARFLAAWTGVGPQRARTLIRRSHALLTAVLAGDDARVRWPSRYERKKHPWYATPPPNPIRL